MREGDGQKGFWGHLIDGARQFSWFAGTASSPCCVLVDKGGGRGIDWEEALAECRLILGYFIRKGTGISFGRAVFFGSRQEGVATGCLSG